MTPVKLIFRIGIVACAIFSAATAHTEQSLSAEDWALTVMYRAARPGRAVDVIRHPMYQRFHSNDVDGGGISTLDRKLRRDKLAAFYRSRIMKNWFAWDLNGDGRVTTIELKRFFWSKARGPVQRVPIYIRPNRELVATRLRDLVAKALKADANNDGSITLTEAMADAKRKANGAVARHGRPRDEIPMLFDLNGDGTITWKEYSRSVEGALKRIDTDGNGKVSEAEYRAIRPKGSRLLTIRADQERARMLEIETGRRVKACAFPRVRAGARVVLVGAGIGRALSTVTFESDQEIVFIGDVRIQPGKQPLYVIITSDRAMIWRFSGAVHRIATVVLTSHETSAVGVPRVGLVGVPRARVYVPPRKDCAPVFRKTYPKGRMRSIKIVERMLGRAPDTVASERVVGTLVLPTARFEPNLALGFSLPAPRHRDAKIFWQRMLHYHPDGVIRINARAVISRVRARDYRVLPQEAGLAQLIEQGGIRYLGGHKGLVSFGRARFLILKRIRVPAGMGGNRAAVFELPEGMPPPEGRLGHSIVVRAATKP